MVKNNWNVTSGWTKYFKILHSRHFTKQSFCVCTKYKPFLTWGVVSKKDIGARRMAVRSLECRMLDALIHPRASDSPVTPVPITTKKKKHETKIVTKRFHMLLWMQYFYTYVYIMTLNILWQIDLWVPHYHTSFQKQSRFSLSQTAPDPPIKLRNTDFLVYYKW